MPGGRNHQSSRLEVLLRACILLCWPHHHGYMRVAEEECEFLHLFHAALDGANLRELPAMVVA